MLMFASDIIFFFGYPSSQTSSFGSSLFFRTIYFVINLNTTPKHKKTSLSITYPKNLYSI